MWFSRSKDLTDFTQFRAWYCRLMVTMMRDKLHLKIFFTLICIALVVGFALFQNAQSEAAFQPEVLPASEVP